MFLGIEQHSEIIDSTLVNQVSTYGSLIMIFDIIIYFYNLLNNKLYEFIEIYEFINF